MVGQEALVGMLSYMAVGRETTYGVYTTATAGVNMLTNSFNTNKEVTVLEEIQTSRTNSNHIYLGKVVEGDTEFYFSPRSTGCLYMLQNAFGGSNFVSSTLSVNTAGAAYQHILDIGTFQSTYSSLCFNVRKGESGTGKVTQYSGGRVNEMGFAAEIDDALRSTVSMIFKDSTIGGTDVSAVLSSCEQGPLSFVSGRLSIEESQAGVTTSSYWHVSSINFAMNNNLMADSGSRRIGSDTLQVLPAGLVGFTFDVTMRYDTTTAYDAMMNNTRLYGEFMFEGDTLAGTTIRQSVKLAFTNLRITNAGDPEIGGPNEMLTSQVSFAVLRGGCTTTAFACQATVVNDLASI